MLPHLSGVPHLYVNRPLLFKDILQIQKIYGNIFKIFVLKLSRHRLLEDNNAADFNFIHFLFTSFSNTMPSQFSVYWVTVSI